MSELSWHEDLIQRVLAAGRSAEALSWLEGGGPGSFRNLVELDTNEESVALVRQAYALGAREVIAAKIDSFPGGENSGRLIVVLPTDPTARRWLFAWSGERARELGLGPDRDYGQRELLIMLD